MYNIIDEVLFLSGGKIMIRNVIVFISSIVLGIILFISIFEYSIRKNIKMYCGKHDNLGHAFMNDLLYLSISSFFLLIFFLLYNSGFFTYILLGIPHINEILESGLFTGVSLIFVGLIINIIYLGVLRLIRFKIALAELEENERTWLMIVGCILLFSVGKIESDFVFAFSALAIIIAKFFWVINNNLQNVKKEIKSLFYLPIYSIIFIISVSFILVIFSFVPRYCIWIIFGLIVGVFIGIIICALLHKENSN